MGEKVITETLPDKEWDNPSLLSKFLNFYMQTWSIIMGTGHALIGGYLAQWGMLFLVTDKLNDSYGIDIKFYYVLPIYIVLGILIGWLWIYILKMPQREGRLGVRYNPPMYNAFQQIHDIHEKVVK